MKRIKLTALAEWIWYFFLFTLPLQTRRVLHKGVLNGGEWEYGTIAVYATDLLIMALLAFGLIFWLKSKKYFKAKTVWWLLAAMELAVFISIFSSLDKSLAFYGWIRVLLAIGVFWLAVFLPYSRIKALVAFSLGAVVQGALALQQMITERVYGFKWIGMFAKHPSDPGVSVVEMAGERLLRAYGSQISPNILGGLLVVAFFALFLLYLKSSRKYQQQFAIAGLFLVSLGIFFSFSRAAWLALFIGVLLWFVFSHLKKAFYLRKFLEFYLLFFLVFAFLAALCWQPFAARVRGGERLEYKSVQERAIYSKEADRIIEDSGAFGVGVNNYTLAVYQKIDNSFDSWAYQPVHNTGRLIRAETGLPGVIAAIGVLFYLILRFIYDKKSDEFEIVFFVQIMALAIMTFFDHWLWSSHVGLLLAGLVMGFYWRSREERSAAKIFI